jgi:predicted GNAT family acetyltransferase
MRLRLASPADHPAITAFLRQHETSSLFPLANLAGGAAQKLWCADGDAGLVGVLALTASGFVMLQWPGLDQIAVARALARDRISGVSGPFDQVEALLEALKLTPGLLRHQAREPLCKLALADLIVPQAQGTRLAPLREQDRAFVTPWRMAYNAETMGQAELGARAQASADVDRWLAAASHRILWCGDQPVALTGLNAKLPDVVQVGGVYVPPALRSQGYARRAVALHLAEAREGGASRAVLFAATAAALRAYQAIGFTQTGWMGLALLHKPMVPA